MKQDAKGAERTALMAARLAGCSCEPSITIREVRPNVFLADCAHAAGCKHPSQKAVPR